MSSFGGVVYLRRVPCGHQCARPLIPSVLRRRLARLGGLVRLKVADQMPDSVEIGSQRHFLERFLDFVLAEIDLTGVGGRANLIGVDGF